MKKKKILYTALFAAFVVVLALPALQMHFKFFKLKPLKGSVNPIEVKFNFENYKTNVFQKQTEEYLKEYFGFKEIMIPCYNQYVWDFYGKTENNGVRFGKDNWLFFYDHELDHYESMAYKYANSCEEMQEIFEKEAKSTYFLQEILKEYGVTLFVGIAPSKDQLYAEFLPKNKQFHKQPCENSYNSYTRIFNELGVNCLDFNAIFKNLKRNVDYPLFYKSSSHYSVISAAYEADTLIKYMEAISGLNIQNVEFGEPYVGKVQGIDMDMEGLFNLIRPMEKTEYKYVTVNVIPDSTAVKPRWLTVGDSFYWNLVTSIPHTKIFNGTPFWYYNKVVHNDPNHNDVSEVDILEELLKSDIVMIYWCPINLYQLDHGFVTRALKSLCYEDNHDDIVKDNLKNYIKNDTNWFNNIVKQAEEKGISVEQSLDDNVEYAIKNNIEKYYPEIFGDSIPTIRNSRIQELLKSN